MDKQQLRNAKSVKVLEDVMENIKRARGCLNAYHINVSDSPHAFARFPTPMRFRLET